MRRNRLIGLMLILCLVSSCLPLSVAEENQLYIGEAVETGRDNGFSGSNIIKNGDPHFGWELGNFYFLNYEKVEHDSNGVPTFYKRRGDNSFSLCFILNYSIDKLNGLDTLRINEDKNGFDNAFGVTKEDFGYGALFMRRTDWQTRRKDATIKRLNWLYGRKPGSSFVVSNSFTEGDYELSLDYEIEEKYNWIGRNWWNYKIAFTFKVRYISDSGSQTEGISAASATSKPAVTSTTAPTVAPTIVSTAAPTAKPVNAGAGSDRSVLVVSSPLFADVTDLGGEFSDDGSMTEYFYDKNDDMAITLIALLHDGSLKQPQISEGTTLLDFVKGIGGKTQYAFGNETLDKVRFSYIVGEEDTYARAYAYWTDNFVLVAIYAKHDPNLTAAEKWNKSLSVSETIAAADNALSAPDTANSVWEIWSGSALTVQKLYAENMMLTTSERVRHGFAAERANLLAGQIKGVFTGKKIEYVGGDNVLNGPDFQLTEPDGSVTLIQSKYYSTAKNSINACFDSAGNFMYYDSNGVPMRIEVPKDQYDDAVAYMQSLIRQGKISGVTDPAEASEIIRQGSVTYKQAVNIAKAGTVESLTYDAAHGCVAAASAFGVSAVVEFALSCWNNEPLDVALNRSIFTGLEVGGSAFIVSVVSSQLSKTVLNDAMIPASRAIVNALGSKAAAVFVNAFRPAGGAIYGAAAKQAAAKLLRGNTITAVVSLVVFTVPDVVDTFRGRMSAKQFFKNTATTAGGIAGGAGGAWAGAAAGSAVLPGVGTVIGGIVGGLVGGLGVSVGVQAIGDLITENDADEMIVIISDEFSRLAEEYLLTADEGERVSVLLQSKITADSLKDMFASKDRNKFADDLIEPIIANEAKNREIIVMPDDDEYAGAMIVVLENIYDEVN